LACCGNRVLATPHVDALADEECVFYDLQVAASMCQPNRGASLMTARSASTHGVLMNGREPSFGERTFVEMLREVAYHTLLLDQANLQSITTVPPAWPAHGEDRLACEARRCFPDICGQEVWRRWEDDPDFDLMRPYSGFEPVCLTIGHADEQYGHWRRCLREQVADADRLIGPEPSLPTPGMARAAHRQVWRTRVPEEFDPTRYIAERCGDWLAERADDGRPFLTRSFPDSHHPFTPPWRFWDMYHPEDVELPANSDAPPRQLPPAMTPLREAVAAGRAREFGHMVFAGMEREAHETLAETLDIGTTVLVRAGTPRGPTGCKGCRCWWSSTDTAIAPPTGWSSRRKGGAAILGLLRRVRPHMQPDHTAPPGLTLWVPRYPLGRSLRSPGGPARTAQPLERSGRPGPACRTYR